MSSASNSRRIMLLTGASRGIGPATGQASPPSHARPPSSPPPNPRRIMLLPGASRGIGHATVKRFSAAGWRVITCSRHGFPENCPWEMGPEDHLQVDLADADDTRRAIGEVKERLAVEGGVLHA